MAGSEGILGRATNAVDKHEIATIKENVELKVAEDVEKFHEEKYVDFSIDNSMSAYEYLKEKTEPKIQKGDEEYTITYIDSTDPNDPDDNQIQVNYVEKGTKLSITGKITQTGEILWEDDEGDIPLSISEPTGNGTDMTVRIKGRKEGWQLQYRVRDTGEWIDATSRTSVTVPAGTTLEVCFFNGTERETISKTITFSYTVTYDGNGATSGSTSNSSHEFGIASTLTANGFTKDGYTFKGWNTNADGTGQAYANGASVTDLAGTNGATVTLYARWQEVPKATATITKSNYGEYVDYTANGINSWRIFLNDGKNIYLITTATVPNSKIKNGVGFNKYGTYGVYNSNANTLKNAILNTSNWTDFTNGTSAGVKVTGATATGGPTGKQFFDSYNGRYGTSYSFKVGDEPSFSVRTGDDLYILNGGDYTRHIYYLAELGYQSKYMTAVYYGRKLQVFGGTQTSLAHGIRVLLKLPTNASMTKSGSKWIIST